MTKIYKNKFFLYSVVALIILSIGITTAFADSVPTSVTVGNSGPSYTVDPAETTASTGTTPTNEGTNVVITATATDSNQEDYYLIVCSTDSVSPTNGDAPSCAGTQYCVSTSTTSGQEASCTIDTTGNATESNTWYAFVCDNNSSAAACSTSSQGTGDSGSPFFVNHRPVFDTISNNSPQDPGSDITFSTAATVTDSDTDTVADTVKLIVCKTTGITNDACDGGGTDTWCSSSYVANSPTCTFTLDNPLADDTYEAYTYVVDNHYFGATGVNQGSNQSFTVNNVDPVVSNVSINGGLDITLTENSTTSLDITATVTDNNACTDISTVESSLYRSGIGYAACDTNLEDDNNNCYAVISCTQDGASCTGATDAAATYTCTVSIQYHADPTDTATQYPTENWLATVVATDDDAATDTTEDSTGVEVVSLVAYDVTASIAYGSLSVGQSNDPLDRTTQFTNTGNTGLDAEFSGTDMSDGGSETIVVGQQEYALAVSTAYGAGTALTTSATQVALDVNKTTVSGSPETKTAYWGIEIPSGTVAGSYSGTNTLTAVKSDSANW